MTEVPSPLAPFHFLGFPKIPTQQRNETKKRLTEMPVTFSHQSADEAKLEQRRKRKADRESFKVCECIFYLFRVFVFAHLALFREWNNSFWGKRQEWSGQNLKWANRRISTALEKAVIFATVAWKEAITEQPRIETLSEWYLKINPLNLTNMEDPWLTVKCKLFKKLALWTFDDRADIKTLRKYLICMLLIFKHYLSFER